MDRQEHRCIDRRRHRCWSVAVTLPLALVLASCSGTPLGEQLSGSFPDGQAAAENPAEADVPAAGATAPGAGPAGPAAIPAGPGAATPPTPAGASPGAAPPGAAPPGAAPAAGVPSPAPYRLTLRLSGADPAAPAEAVTQALRAAGLAFEVEVIERIPEAPAPASTSAPEPAHAPASR
jgi:hypothetical protein